MASLYPDVKMYKCPIQGVVFFAEMCGEKRFKTAKDAQDACNLARRLRDEAEAMDLWASRYSEPDRIEARRESCVIDRIVSGEVVETIQCRDKYHFRSLLGALCEKHPIFFYEKPSDNRILEKPRN